MSFMVNVICSLEGTINFINNYVLDPSGIPQEGGQLSIEELTDEDLKGDIAPAPRINPHEDAAGN